MLGAIVGSYLATIILRWPRGEAARGRSHCDGCGIKLAARDLVPLLSFAWAGGRCRECGGRIDRQHLIIEALAAAIGAVALLTAPGLPGVAGALFGWTLLALAALDLEHFWLPDRLNLTLALFGFAAGVAGIAPALSDRLIGGIVGFLALTAIAWAYRLSRGRDGMGAGDAKLLGAIGLWLGWRALPFVLLAASLIGLAGLLVRRIGGRPVSATMRVPLGTLLAAAAWLLWLAQVTETAPL